MFFKRKYMDGNDGHEMGPKRPQLFDAGRPTYVGGLSGGCFNREAFCVLAYPLQVDFALQRNRQNMGRWYIEVFRSKRQEYYSAIAHETFYVRPGSPLRVTPRAKSSDDGKDLIEHTRIL
ncbi:hypothetical protein AXF42_Ash005273 [Apostasia shenzhenica]|uniref:Uncharacterized protein n=1 Tax=Apostasia shenzhenica TaxID=1088818 RepID=A0A2I0B6F1_9ASPA|nr:hypothetical protein AXF42_Ash005273 [Apostasia shenzhenica]